MTTSFVVGCSGDDLERDTPFVFQFLNYGAADHFFVCGGVANFLGSPMDVDFVRWKPEIFRKPDA